MVFVLYFSDDYFLVSCAGRYRIRDKYFSSSSEALQFHAAIFTKLLEDIEPTKKPIQGSVLVLIPSDAEILKNFIKFGNNAGYFKKEDVDFIITVGRTSFQFM
jgi:hypothetical protein